MREFQIGQYIREEGPKAHQKKSGTPTMGGVLIAIAIVSRRCCGPTCPTDSCGSRCSSTFAFAAIGFTDDVQKWATPQPWPHRAGKAGAADRNSIVMAVHVDRDAGIRNVFDQTDRAFLQTIPGLTS